MRQTFLWAVALLLAVAATPGSVAAQILSLGGRVSYSDIDTGVADGAVGVGGHLLLSFPVIGLRVQGTGEFQFPDCGEADCDLQDVGLNLLWGPIFPAVDPYLGAGLVVLNTEGALGDTRDVGLNLLAGLAVGKLFGEAKVQLMQDLDNQLVVTGGFSIPIL